MEILKCLTLLLVAVCLCVLSQASLEENDNLSLPSGVSGYDVIVIDPTNHLDKVCYSQAKESKDIIVCPDLNRALKYSMSSSTAYVLASGMGDATHYLFPDDEHTLFRDKMDIMFLSNSSTESAHVQCQQEDAGLGFWNVDRIVLRNVVFSYCGALRISTSRNFSAEKFEFEWTKISLYFYNCTNVTLDRVVVQHSVDAMGVGMYNTDGTVNVLESHFINNTVREGVSLPGGGGFAVEFSYCVPGYTGCQYGSDIQTTHNSYSGYTFSGSTFRDNVARVLGPTIRLLSFNSTFEGMGRGGGLGLFLKSNATGNSIRIVDCTFEGNVAQWGGGIYLNFGDHCISNEIVLDNVTFNENCCFFVKDFGTGGGGIKISAVLPFDYSSHSRLTGNSIKVYKGSFWRNKAISGGAISYTPAHQNQSFRLQTTTLEITDSNFYENIARLGAALHVELFPLFSNGSVNPVLIKNCSFTRNTIDYYGKEISSYDVGIGTIYAYEVSLYFRSVISFSDNYGSALALIGAHADFSDSSVSFVGNQGNIGGGLSLLGSSHFVMNDESRIHFANNTAVDGSAIYNHVVSQGVMKSNIICFARYDDPFRDTSDWKAVVTFENNTGSRAIFSTSVYPCTFNNKEMSSNISENLVFCSKAQWNFINSSCTEEIETQGNEYKVTESLIRAFPGKGFELPIVVYDDLNHDITESTGYSSMIPDGNHSKYSQVDPKYSLTSENFLVITGLEEYNETLEVQSTGSRSHFIRLDVFLQKCPPGFVFTYPNNSDNGEEDKEYLGRCMCVQNSYGGNLNCSEEDFEAYIPWNYWIGLDPTGEREDQLIMSELPNIYAEQLDYDSNIIILPRLYEEVDDSICGRRNRTGTLCGRCKQGYAAAVNSYNYVCTPCNDDTQIVKNILLYLMFAYVPYVILFSAIIFFNLKLTSSATNGFILFAQLISSVDLFDISSHVETSLGGMHEAYMFVYGVFNLKCFADILHPFCISKTFNTLDVLCLEYTLSILPLLIIPTIYIVLRLMNIRCLCYKRNSVSISARIRLQMKRKAKGNTKEKRPLLHSLAAFLLLSYTKMSMVSMKILAATYFFDQNGKTLHQSRVYLAGNLLFSSREYFLPYGAVALFIMIFPVIIPTLFLLGIPQLVDRLLDKKSFRCFRKFWPTLTIHAILDTFQGYYKPNFRFFSGFYLVFRLAIIISYVTSNDYLHQYFFQQICVTVMIALLAVFKPYKREIFNLVDIAIFLDLAIINSIDSYFYSRSLTLNGLGKAFPTFLYFIRYLLLWLPFFYILSYVVYKVMTRCGLFKYIKRKRAKRSQSQSRGRLNESLPEEPLLGGDDLYEDNSDSSSEEDEDLALFKRAQIVNRFRPLRTVHRTLVEVLDEEEEGDILTESSGIGTSTTS